ncbi:MAG: hypothetical protein M4579_005094 [Chaenotheca gracillima]|nr:MAG: hypothetical protein M4579_005094 [Chaenotheca gracillima]
MPSLVRKYLIYAAVDGLILQPLSPSRNAQQQHAATPGLSPPLKIEYKSHAIVPVKGDDSSTAASLAGQSGKQGPSLEGFGVVGLLNVSSHAFLISISQRQQVGQIRGKPIYAVTDVAVIPLSSQSEANDALTQAKDSIRQQQNGGKGKRSLDDSDEDESEDDRSVIEEDELQDDDLTLPTTPDRSESRAGDGDNARQRTQSTVAEDVMTRKGMYGRFAERWFSRRGWSVEKRRMQGMSTEESEKDSDAPETVDGQTAPSEESPAEPADTAKEFEAPTEPDKASDVATAANKGDEDTPKGGVTLSLLPKLLRTTKMLFGSRNFFFSYDYDITHSVGTQRSNASNLPLHRIADSQYFWNRHISLPFIRSSQDAFVLPVMQGFVGQCSFAVQKSPSTESADKVVKVHEDVGDIIEDQENPEKLTSSENAEKGFLLTLISRRSVERAGLRYLRRGVDDLGHAANTVETEQILSSPTWDQSEKTYSFTQLRGSIPLYFSQSPYAFKPVPELHHSSAANYEAFRKHFANIGARYGKVQVATLIEKHGNEGRIGEEYEKNASKLNADGGVNGSPLGFEWFDFHDACRGMKFENVSMLVDKLGETISEFGSTVQHNGKILSQQTGVLRTNCMDCLDRTNVAQSAFAKQVLDSQLMSQGFDLKLQSDQTTQWFNTIWADHGDAISKQYSSTAALKGDYTRTRKRDYRGALNDFGLTLSRYYNNIVNDYFSQAVIDYLQGSVNAQVFEDFEANMMSVDPAISVDKVRQNASE